MHLAVRRSSAALAAAAVLVLSGCAFGSTTTSGAGAPESPAPASSTPTATVAADPLTTVTEIVVRPEQLDLLDAGGAVVATLPYDAETADFVGALTTVLAGEPQQADLAGGMERAPWTEYAWAGMVVEDDHEDQVPTENGAVYGPIELNLAVRLTAPVVGDGVIVRTVNGFQPGGDAQALAAELGEPWTGNGYDQVRVESGEPIGEPQAGLEYENAYSVAVNTWEHDGATNWILAPWNFGIGHV